MPEPISCDLAGTRFRGIAAQVLVSQMPDQTKLSLVAEPTNPYDRNAIKVFHPDGTHIGYVPKGKNVGVLHNGLDTAEAFWDAANHQIDITWPPSG